MGRDVGGGSGWGTHVNPWLIHVNVWQKPLQFCKVISLQLIKIKKKKKVSVRSPGTASQKRDGLSLPLSLFFPLLVVLCILQDLSSLIGDRTQIFSSESRVLTTG